MEPQKSQSQLNFDNINKSTFFAGGIYSEEIEKLLKDKEDLIKSGDYLKAEAVKQMINKLKSEEKSSFKKDVENRHYKEMKDLEDQFLQELNNVNEFWQKEYESFEEQLSLNEKSLEEKHKNEIQELKTNEENKLMKTFKHSKEYLDCKNAEIYLVKLERFVEAHVVKQKAEALEKIEIERHMKSIDDIINQKIENLYQRQLVEKNGYKQKLMSEYEEMKTAKQIEMDKLIVKYKNKKLDLEIRQKREKNLNENDNLLKANIYSSNLTNMSIINSVNNAQNKPSNKSTIKFSFENPSELKLKNSNVYRLQSGKRSTNNSSILISKQSPNEIKSERKASAKHKISKHNNYETNYKIANKPTLKNKNQTLTVSQHLLKECDLEHKKPVNVLNRRSSQTKDSTAKSNFTKRVLEFNDNFSSDFKTNKENNGNFAVNFLGGSEINKKSLENKNFVDSGCKETNNFINEELTKNINDINSFDFLKANESEQKLNYYNLKKDILSENFEEQLDIN